MATTVMETLAPAKINLHLGVSRTRDEHGYHLLKTVMCPLDLSDVVCVEELPCAEAGVPGGEPFVKLTCEPDPVGDPRDNLAHRAAVALARQLGRAPHLHIAIEKRIPSQAGLGGGSSDAAAVLRCLAALWGLSAGDPVVVDVARGLGADVPFFLYEGTCLMAGRGDELVERLYLPSVSLVLAKPPVGVSTPAAYRAFDELGTSDPAPDALLALLRDGASARGTAPTMAPITTPITSPASDDVSSAEYVRAIARACANNLQPATCAVEPQVAATIAWLAEQPEGLATPLLCGSGACCALFVPDDGAARAVVARAASRGLWAYSARTLAS